MKVLVVKKQDNSLSLPIKLIVKWGEKCEKIRVKTKSRGDYWIYMSDFIIEHKKKGDKLLVSKEFWHKI